MTIDLEVLKGANMTQTQLQIWIAQMLSGRRPVYNMGMAIEILSDLDVDRFRDAFDFVVNAALGGPLHGWGATSRRARARRYRVRIPGDGLH